MSIIEASYGIGTAGKESVKNLYLRYRLKILNNQSVELGRKTAGRGLSVPLVEPLLDSDLDESVRGEC